MNYIIYLDADKQMKAQMCLDEATYNAFADAIPKGDVLYVNGQAISENIPEDQLEVFNIFLKSQKRQWDSRKVIVAPQIAPPVVEAPVAAKKPRRKKA